MEMEGCREIDLELEADGLIDDKQFSGAVNAENGIGLSIDENDHLPELPDSVEPGQTKKNGRFNLRKSLAWDSAFFTSAGVLDAEELTSMISQADKGKHFLPGIQEDITGSTESISTHESDNLTLENLDDDLFLDIRASIQRSSEKASKLTNSSTKFATEVVDSAAISSLSKQEVASQNKNPKSGLKKKIGLEAVRMPKCQPKQNSGKLGSAKAIKQDSGHSQMTSTTKSVATNTKPPKLPTSAVAAKRESVGTSRLKPNPGSSKPATIPSNRTQAPKVSVPSGARRALPKPALQAKSLFPGSSNTNRMHSTRSSTSSDSSSNTSSGTFSKSTLVAARRIIGKSSNVGTSSIPKTPSKTALKNKSISSTLSASVSPASSISEWSSASSSSSSMVNQRCNNSRTSLDTSSHRPVDLASRNHSVDHSADRNKSHVVPNNSRRSSTQSGSLQAPAKPSGLRMPSPKIGFFDGVKSGTRTPNGAPASSPIRSSNSKLKSAKTPTARAAFSSAGIKRGSPKAASPASSSQEKSLLSLEASDIPKDVKDPLASFEEISHALVDASGIPKDIKDSQASFEEKSLPLVDASSVPTNAKDHPASLEEKSSTSEDASDVPADSKDSPASFEEKSYALVDASDVPIDAKDSEKSPAFTIASDVPTDINDSAASFEEKLHALVKTSDVPADAKDSPASFKDSSHASLGTNGNAARESCRKAENVQSEDAVNQVIIMKENSSDFDLHKNMGSVDIKNPSFEVTNAPSSENIDQNHHLEKNFDPTDEATAKEDSCANYRGEKLEGDNEQIYHNVHGLSDNLLSDASEWALYVPPTSSEPSVEVTNAPGSENIDQNHHLEKNFDPIDEATDNEDSCANYLGEKLQGDNAEIDHNVHGLSVNLLSDASEQALSVPTSSEPSVEVTNAPGSENIDQNHHLEKDFDPTDEATAKEDSCANYRGEKLRGDNVEIDHNVHGLSDNLLSDASERALYLPPTATESAVSRTPLAPKNSFCSNECVDMSKQASLVAVADKNSMIFPSTQQKENS